MAKKKQLYEVEIKSKSLLGEGMKSLITYFEGGDKKTIASNVRRIYPQYTRPEDEAVVLITPITRKEYQRRLGGKTITQKQRMFFASGFVMQEEDYDEALGD